MKCEKCGEEIICTGWRVPDKCNFCGTKFHMEIHNIGFLIYLLGSMAITVLSILALKRICNMEWILYIVSIVEIVIVADCMERLLCRIGLMKYKNVIYEK